MDGNCINFFFSMLFLLITLFNLLCLLRSLSDHFSFVTCAVISFYHFNFEVWKILIFA